MTPDQVAKRWSDRIAQSVPDIQAGIQNVKVSPTQLAAAKQDKMLARLTAAVQSGKWAAGLKAVSLQDWQNAAITKGIPRISQGAQAAQPKFSAFMAKLQPYQDSLSSTVKAMPDLTLQDSINRVTAWMTGMSKFKK